MVPVSAARPGYRPCPNCGGTGVISEEKADARRREKAAREARKDRAFGWIMIIAGLGICYGAVAHAKGAFQLILIGIVIACFYIGGRNL